MPKSITRLFDEAEDEMRRAFHGWENDMSHQGEKGGIRERRVADFLVRILPRRYGIGTGHIVDAKGGVSNQVDIVVYDALDGIRYPIDDNYSVFPCECVFAAIEVKSRLTASKNSKSPGTIYECIANTMSVKALDRTNADLPPIYTAVFAYGTQWSKNQEEKINYWLNYFYNEKRLELPDIILVLEPGFVSTYEPLGATSNHVGSISLNSSPLLYFITELSRQMQNNQTIVPNLYTSYKSILGVEFTLRTLHRPFVSPQVQQIIDNIIENHYMKEKQDGYKTNTDSTE